MTDYLKVAKDCGATIEREWSTHANTVFHSKRMLITYSEAITKDLREQLAESQAKTVCAVKALNSYLEYATPQSRADALRAFEASVKGDTSALDAIRKEDKEKIAELEDELESMNTNCQGWIAKCNSQKANIQELERKLAELECKLAARMLVRPIDVDAMVTNFLGWKLPEHFRPDAGISFVSEYNIGTPYQRKHEPIGTNLFDAEQAREMILAILPKSEVSTDSVRKLIAEAEQRGRVAERSAVRRCWGLDDAPNKEAAK